MDRKEAVLLLKEIMTECESFNTATTVSIEHNKAKDSWELHVNWAPNPIETQDLNKMVAKHGLQIVKTNERTVFCSL